MLVKGPGILIFFTHTLAYAHSRTRSLAQFTSFEVYFVRFAPNCNTSPGLAGAVGSSYEDMMKDTEEKLIEVR